LTLIRIRMYIEGRGKNAVLLSAVWLLVPVTFLLLHIPLDAFSAIIALASVFFHVFGVLAYLGFYEGFAGFNTATDEELSHFNMEKMTVFLGVSFCLAGCSFFIIMMVLKEQFGILTAMFTGIAYLLVILISASVYMTVSKRFKASP